MADETPEVALPEGVPPQPDDFETIPYEYNPAVGAWVKLID